MPDKQKHWFRGARTPQKVAVYAGCMIGAILFVSASVLVLFPDTYINGFLKDRIVTGITKADPDYALKIGGVHYNIWKNNIQCDSITLKNADTTLQCSIALLSVKKINWMKILLHGKVTPHVLSNSTLDAKKIVVNFPKSHKRLRLGMLHISVPDSQIVADSNSLYTLINDEQFFGKSNYRQTRFSFTIPQIKIMGLNCLTCIQGNGFKARSITLQDFFADILVNMDKPYRRSSSKPQMPNEALASMKGIVKVDSLNIINGRLKYSERYAVHARPGVISFNKVMLSVTGIANHTTRPDTAVLHGEGIFMNSGTMTLFMALPLSSREFSLRYSGSLSTMNLAALNVFLEPAEQRRIKSGIVTRATYSINVNSGHASGILHATYKDLTIAILDKKTGSEKGIINRISSLIGKLFIIHGSNMPEDGKIMKVGTIKYTRNPDDYFTQFLWFGLRSGVGNIIGF